MKNYTLTLLLTAAPLFAGTHAPVVASQSNTEQGWTLGIEPMAMAPYTSSNWANNDYSFAGRGSLGYQFADGLFIAATYFGYSGDLVDHSEDFGGYSHHETGRMSATYIDLVIGQNFKPTETLKLSPYVGLRWAADQAGYTTFHTNTAPGSITIPEYAARGNVQGLGIVLGMDATRALGNDFSIYGTVKESVIFGTSKTADTGSLEYSGDTVASISELGLGVQYDFCFSGVASNIRLGVEGQWWAISNPTNSTSGISSNNFGLAGLVLGANFRF